MDCEFCGGPMGSLGVLGRLEHFKCRNCGNEAHRPYPMFEVVATMTYDAATDTLTRG